MSATLSNRHMSTRHRQNRVPFVEVRRSVHGLGFASRLTCKWGVSYVYSSTRDGYLHITPWERTDLTDRLLCVVGNLTPPEAIQLLREEVLVDSVH
jgi:hypothetical protein